MWLVYIQAYHTKWILALKIKLEEQTSSKIPTNDLVKLAEFVLENILFFNLTMKLGNRSLVLLLGLSLRFHMPVFIWIQLR